jgi:recombination protein RecT
MGRTKGSKNKPKNQDATGAALATTGGTIGTYLSERKDALASYAVRQYNVTEFMRSASLAISESPKLAKALKTAAGQRSLYNALRFAAATGLSLNPQQGKAALVPYRNRESGDVTVNYQIMKNGLIDLVMETGQVKDLVADLVRANDRFEVERTQENDSYCFVPKRRDRGEVDGYFAAITLTTGRTHVAYMAIEEIEEHKERYNASKALKDRSPWVHSFDGMAIKTVIKKLLRNLHLSPETGAAVTVDDQSEFGSDVIDVEAEPPTVREGAPKSNPGPDGEETPGTPPDPPAEEPGASDERGASADDVASAMAASDAAADEQGGDDSEADDTVI